MLKALKIRLYPNVVQATQINKLLGCYRFVYNKCLDKKISSYKIDNTSENLTTLGYYFHNELTKCEEYSWLNEQNTKVLKQSIRDMLDAYSHFFKEKKGFPKFKSKHSNKLSCRFPLEAISKRNDYSTYRLSLANIYNIRFKCSDKYVNYLVKYKDGIRSATLSKTCTDEYYLSILVNGDFRKKLKYTNDSVGIDLGIKEFIVTSDGECFDNLHFKKAENDKLKRLQRQLSKKQKDSKNRDKARLKLAKLNEKIRNRKLNYLHKITNQLLDENQIIALEDLNVKGMMKNHKLADSIGELNFGEFRRILTYKSVWYGRDLVFVDRFYPSSKTCNHCGYINKTLKLQDRQWRCPQCGKIIERDYNAALNILDEGIRIIGSRTPKFTLVENPTMDDKVVIPLKSSDSLKQEIDTYSFL